MKTLVNAVRAAALAIAGLMTAGTAAAAQADYYLKIDTIEGESADARHRGWIEILSCDMSVSVAPGLPPVTSFSVSKLMDKSSPLLMKACADGNHIPRVKLECLDRIAPANARFYEIVLEDVLVSSWQTSASPGGNPVPTENVTFIFARSRTTFTQVFADGSPGEGTEFFWDILSGVTTSRKKPPFQASMGPDPQGQSSVRWLAEQGRVYRARAATSPAGPWTDLTQDIPGTGAEVSIPVPASGPRLFLLVEEIP